MIGTSIRRRLLAVAVMLWTVLAVLSPAPAVAASPPKVEFKVSSLSVSGTRPSDRVVLSGTVTNTGEVPAYGVQVILWRSQDPIRDLSTLRAAAENYSGWGSRLPITADHYRVITSSTQAFAPGESRDVRLRATLSDLGFEVTAAAYAFGADVIASERPGGGFATAGGLRTFVPMPGKVPVPVTRMVLLSARPTKLADNVFANDDLAGELTGRLGSLLGAAARLEMSWLIDPALLDEVADMADGYQVGQGQDARPGGGQGVAASWLAGFEKLDRTRGGRTVFANPDLTGARTAEAPRVVEQAARVARDARLDGLPLVVVPAETTLSQATYEFAAGLGAAAMLAGNTTQAGAWQRASGSAGIIAVTRKLESATTPVQQRQFTLAVAAIAGPGGQARLLSDTDDLAADTRDSANWLGQLSLGDLIRQAPSATASFTATESAQLDKAHFATIDRLAQELGAYGELVSESSLAAQSDQILSRAAAQAWIQAPEEFKSYRNGLNAMFGPAAVSAGVQLDASGRFLMSSRANQFPVTVTNRLSEAIRVRVVVTTDSPQRLSVPPTEVITVEPGRSETVNVRPQASSNGLVVAFAHLATESGKRVTPDTRIIIEITDLGMVGWLIITVSGLVLVGATAWRIRQVRRRDRAGELH